MTLSIMENHDAIKTALKDYQKATGEIPKVLERYLEYVARTGKPLFSWDLISCLVMKKFENVFDDFIKEKPVICLKTVNSDNFSAQDLKLECIQALNSLTGVPFTIQRVCELLLSPKKNYSKLEKFLRGFLRVVKVVTTVDRIGQKITTESQLFANALSPFGSGDNSWSGFSGQSDEQPLSNEAQLHNTGPDNIADIDSKRDIDYDDMKALQTATICVPRLDDSMDDSFPSKMIDQEQQTSENAYQTEQQYFPEPSSQTIAMPPIGALFKPIDQLEAFVQNVSNQVESSTSTSSGSTTTTAVSVKVEESKKRTSCDEKVVDSLLLADPEDSLHQLSSSSGGSIDDIDEYSGSSPAKKRKIDTVSQEAVISSSDVSDENEQRSSSSSSMATVDNNDNNTTTSDNDMDTETEALPMVSSQASSVCASEEPSSSTTTNEVKSDDDDDEVEEDEEDEDEDGLKMSVAGGEVIGAGADDGCRPMEEDNESACVTVDAGHCHGEAVVVEAADQSNCVEDEDDEEEEAAAAANKEEPLSSSSCDKEANSIDEETGEHV